MMRALLPAIIVLTGVSLMSTGCSKSPPADKPDGASASEVVLRVPGMT